MRLAAATLVFLFFAACGGHTTPPAPAQSLPPSQPDVIALLPDPETKAVGAAVVSSTTGESVELTSKHPVTRVEPGKRPKDPFELSDDEIQTLFGDALAARPPAPRQFLLYFLFDSDQLTPESESLLAEILAFVKDRPAPDVTVIGHTDTTSSVEFNIDLGRRRATMIRNRLVAVGVDGNLITVASHGEADLLVPTPDDTPEPKNRRVEVSVR